MVALVREADMSSMPIVCAPSATAADSKPRRVRVLDWKNSSYRRSVQLLTRGKSCLEVVGDLTEIVDIVDGEIPCAQEML